MHVPDEELPRYRKLVALAGVLECMGNTRSGKGDYAGAHEAWAQEARIRKVANELRVPGRDGK